MKFSSSCTAISVLSLCLWQSNALAQTHSEAKRVISLAPHATELAYSAGLGDNLIAVSEKSDYPPEADKLPKVANYQGIKVEKIIALQPDLILAWPAGNPRESLRNSNNLALRSTTHKPRA